jgi:hypothetical protein
VKLKLTAPSTVDGSEYEGEYHGVKVRIERRTDLDHRGYSATIWHGFVWLNDDWSVVAENYSRMTDAVYETQRWIRHAVVPREETP